MQKNNSSARFVFTAITFACIILLVLSHHKDTISLLSGVDMSLSTEVAQSKEVLQAFWQENPANLTIANPQEAGKAYIPQNAVCTNIHVIGDLVYLDYRMDNVRYIVSYHTDGFVKKAARYLDGDVIYSINSETEQVKQEKVFSQK